MLQPGHLHVPHAKLPPYLEGLEPPVSTNEALEWAEAHGASPEELRFIEALPAAVFTSETGIRHAFSSVRDPEMAEADPEEVEVSADGTSS